MNAFNAVYESQVRFLVTPLETLSGLTTEPFLHLTAYWVVDVCKTSLYVKCHDIVDCNGEENLCRMLFPCDS